VGEHEGNGRGDVLAIQIAKPQAAAAKKMTRSVLQLTGSR
jgi:hypothetical protein